MTVADGKAGVSGPGQDDIALEGLPSLYFNGVNGATGEYLFPPLRPRELAEVAANGVVDPAQAELAQRWARAREPNFAPIAGVNAEDLAQAGWGIVFAPDTPPAVREALAPLVRRRKEQAGGRFSDFPGERAYRIGDTKYRFLGRSGAGSGDVDPDRMPYYLLLVGSPDAIPFQFQYQMDVQHAVGRIWFETPEAYASYAHSVVAAEKVAPRSARDVCLFGVRHDPATRLSADQLIVPLAEALTASEPSWSVRSLVAEQATKANLSEVLGGPRTPALLVTASHGLGFPATDPRQIAHQGALLCQDWSSPQIQRGPVPPEFYFAGSDVPPAACVHGLIAFFFACYGGGTPQFEDFERRGQAPAQIAPRPFIAALPQALLGHPAGGALAVIAHVERAWGYSFMWPGAGRQSAVFESTIHELLAGRRVGHAMECFGRRYGELSTDLTAEMNDRMARRPRPEADTLEEDEGLSGLWTANNDARSYIVLGDPAVRLAAPTGPVQPGAS